MRGVGLLVAIGVGVFLAQRNNLEPGFASSNWEEVSAKVSQNAGPVLKHVVPFIVAAYATAVSAFVVSGLLARKIYPINSSGKGQKGIIKNDYQKLPTSQKVVRALVLVISGAVVGGLLGKIMTSALHLNPSYYRNTTVALAGIGAGTGGAMASAFHFVGTGKS